MPDFDYRAAGLYVNSQIPLSVKEYFPDEASMLNLGQDNHKAYSYFKGMIVYCVEERKRYEWREVLEDEPVAGMLEDGFTYPNGLSPVFGVDYSGKTYNFFFKPEGLEIVNVGVGVDLYQGFNLLTQKHEVSRLVSTSLEIQLMPNKTVRIDQPASAIIPGLYVNSLYVPTYSDFQAGITKGLGTVAKPFTNTVTYIDPNTPVITPNTAVQNAKEYYINHWGATSGTASAPTHIDEEIILQNNNFQGYYYDGTLNVQGLKMRLQCGFVSTTNGYVIDFSNAVFTGLNAYVQITIEAGWNFHVYGQGFHNIGKNINTNTYQNTSQMNFFGDGTLYTSYDDQNRALFNSDWDSTTGYNNDGGLMFNVVCNVRCDKSPIYRIGGRSRIDFYKKVLSGILLGEINYNLKAYYQSGGQVRIWNSAQIEFQGNVVGAPDPATRKAAFWFEPKNGYEPTLLIQGASIAGSSEVIFKKVNTTNVNLNVTKAGANYGLFCLEVFESVNPPGEKWPVNFDGNVIGYGHMDTSIVDLTLGNNYGAVNSINGRIIKVLPQFPSRAVAVSTGMPQYTEFINTNNNNASHATWFPDITIP